MTAPGSLDKVCEDGKVSFLNLLHAKVDTIMLQPAVPWKFVTLETQKPIQHEQLEMCQMDHGSQMCLLLTLSPPD